MTTTTTTTTTLVLALLGFGYASGNPLLGLVDPACFVVGNADCPNENVTFWLYSKWDYSATPFKFLCPTHTPSLASVAAPHAMHP